jgi:YbgC/YbaW family acyl-CoA thioester hydrolase
MTTSDKKYEYKLQIKEFHLDSYRHVNNATYVQLYEEARWDFLTQAGFGFDQIHVSQKGPVVLEVHVKYRKELNNREWITITSYDFFVKGKILKLKHQMIKENGDIASEAELTFGYMDLAARKLLVPPKEWLEPFGLAE